MRYLHFDRFRLDTSTRELSGGDGSPIQLTSKAFDTLCLLIEHRDRVVTKDELLGVVWAGRVVEENNLNQAIAALRRALGTSAGEHRHIVTIPGRGYRFVSELRVEELSAPESRAAPPQPPPQVAQRPARGPHRVLAALAAAAVLVALAWRWAGHSTPDISPPPAPAVRSTPSALAVLPFRLIGEGPDDHLLRLGLAETLITRIGGASAISVRSLDAVQGMDTAGDALEAGRKLDVTHVLEGTVQRRGDRVRIGARLLEVASGAVLWSDSFDEEAGRVFMLQDRIATALGPALAMTLPAAPARSPCEGADDEAYRAFLDGQYHLSRPTAERMQRALESFRRAIERDPACSKAYAGLAIAYRSLVMTGDRSPRELLPLAKAAVDRALAIKPGLAEGFVSRGFIQFWYDWDWVAAEASFKRAIELNPNLAEAHIAYAHLLNNLGRADESAFQARLAVELDPLSPLFRALAIGFLRNAGRNAEADRMNAALEDIAPGFWLGMLVRGNAYLQAGNASAAVRELAGASSRCGQCSQALAPLGAAHARNGDRPAAMAVLADLQRRRAIGYLPATSLARVYLALGDTERALDWLERGYEERDVRMAFLKVDPWGDLEQDPRFQDLKKRMNL